MIDMTGRSTVLIGLQYGDEGKARVLDILLQRGLPHIKENLLGSMLASELGPKSVNGLELGFRGSPIYDLTKLMQPPSYDIVARFNGGANAGHTLVVNGQTIALHQIPSGIFHPKMDLFIGSGCALNPGKLQTETVDVKNLGISLEGRLHISPSTSLVQPHHVLLDSVLGKGIGSTGNGIGPLYADRAFRVINGALTNLTLSEYLSDPDTGKEHAKANMARVAEQFGLGTLEPAVMNEFHEATLKLAPNLARDPLFLQRLFNQGKNIFFEGAQSVMLDNVTGTLPCVTSSRTVAGAAYTGDLAPDRNCRIIGVAKAIMSRVGYGPFVTELGGEESENYFIDKGENPEQRTWEEAQDLEKLLTSDNLFDVGMGLRVLGKEYGATTGRPRRVGMLDLVMLKQVCELNSVDELYITKFDCLEHFSRTNLKGIPVVVGYKLNGESIDYLPTTQKEMGACEPRVVYLSNIRQDISKVRTYEDLPREAKRVIEFIEEHVGRKVYGVGVGPEREQFVHINSFNKK